MTTLKKLYMFMVAGILILGAFVWIHTEKTVEYSRNFRFKEDRGDRRKGDDGEELSFIGKSNSSIKSVRNNEPNFWITNSKLDVELEQNITTSNTLSKGKDITHGTAKKSDSRTPDVTHADVVLFTYMRGGSTFLGEILGQIKDAFYLYEPLRNYGAYKYFGTGGTCHQNFDICQNNSGLTSDRIVDLMKKMSLCQLDNIKAIGDHLRSFKGGRSWQQFRLCQQENKTEKQCLAVLRNSCLSSRFRVSKVIRLSMDIVQTILEEIESLKVIYLPRDPRPIMMSRQKGGMGPVYGNLYKSVPALCHKMITDIEEGKTIESLYPDRFKMITYESLAQYPLKGAVELYKFIKYSYSQTDLDRIYNMTHASGVAPERVYRTLRNNSSHTAIAWMENMNSPIVKIADKYCTRVYDKLGYYKPRSAT